MGGLLDAMSASKLEGQRDVVQNERRQNYENRPYGLLWETAYPLLYPSGHPYSWTTIGSMADLEAASVEDVMGFFRTYYAPNNASIAIVGDVNPQQVRQWVERYFSWIPRGTPVERPRIALPQLSATTYTTREDRVTLPELTIVWRTGPRLSQDDAALNALPATRPQGKSSRLYKRLVYDEQVAAFTSAWNDATLLSGDLWVRVRAKPDVDLDRIEAAVDEEVARLAQTPPSQDELARVI